MGLATVNQCLNETTRNHYRAAQRLFSALDLLSPWDCFCLQRLVGCAETSLSPNHHSAKTWSPSSGLGCGYATAKGHDTG